MYYIIYALFIYIYNIDLYIYTEWNNVNCGRIPNTGDQSAGAVARHHRPPEAGDSITCLGECLPAEGVWKRGLDGSLIGNP